MTRYDPTKVGPGRIKRLEARFLRRQKALVQPGQGALPRPPRGQAQLGQVAPRPPKPPRGQAQLGQGTYTVRPRDIGFGNGVPYPKGFMPGRGQPAFGPRPLAVKLPSKRR